MEPHNKNVLSDKIRNKSRRVWAFKHTDSRITQSRDERRDVDDNFSSENHMVQGLEEKLCRTPNCGDSRTDICAQPGEVAKYLGRVIRFMTRLKDAFYY